MRKKLIIAVIALIVIGGFFIYSKNNKKTEITYKNFPIEKSSIEVTILATGTVQPKNRLDIKAPVAGRIEEVLVQEGKTVKKGQILAWMSSTERAAMLDAARSKGESEYQKWLKLYLPTPVLAPIDGMIILKSVEPGQTFTSADAIFTMSDYLTVKAQVDETDISQIRLHSNASIVLDAYPNDPIKARVDQLAFDASTTNNVTTYPIDVLPNKTPDFMRSGMTANVTFYVNNKTDILVVPAEALKVKDGKTMVLVKRDNKQQEVVIKTGISDGKNTEVLDGLSDNEILLIQNYDISSSKNDSSNPFSPKFPKKGTGSQGSRK